ncbi:MAG: hypothetical protein EOP48_21245 [Sphingobacteriales bacterium]|nr:MAG: hypothetical protein EOP48_21245 [Sphingobacteriales bacterium]
MKKNMLLCLSGILMIAIASCGKTDPTPSSNASKLSKSYFWNPSTNVQTLSYQFSYNSDGRFVSATTGNNDTYSTEYDAGGKLTKLTKTNPNGRSEVSVFAYSSGGQLIKVSQTSTSGGNPTGSAVIDYEYNSAGKISKSVTVYPTVGTFTVEYTWTGDNVSESKSSNTSNANVNVAKFVYDTKLSPYSSSAVGVGLFFNAGPTSKNNVTEITTTYAGTTSIQKRTYEYNTDDYAISMKLADGSNEGAKFEYVK